jgi:hypothetical protein
VLHSWNGLDLTLASIRLSGSVQLLLWIEILIECLGMRHIVECNIRNV